MANIWENAISILAGNLNLGHSYLITTVINVNSILSLQLRPHAGQIDLIKISFSFWYKKMETSSLSIYRDLHVVVRG